MCSAAATWRASRPPSTTTSTRFCASVRATPLPPSSSLLLSKLGTRVVFQLDPADRESLFVFDAQGTICRIVVMDIE
jgi:hypothetical protein